MSINEINDSSLVRQKGGPMHGGAQAEGSAVQAVGRVKQYIDENFCESLHLDDLAELVGMTRFSLSKRFRQRFGVSPYRYVCLVRVRQAQSMMERGLRLTEVASETGFFDQSHLARHFKRWYGMTPNQYRARCIQSAAQ